MSFDLVGEGVGLPQGPAVMPGGSAVIVEVGRGRPLRLRGDGWREVLDETGGSPNDMIFDLDRDAGPRIRAAFLSASPPSERSASLSPKGRRSRRQTARCASPTASGVFGE